MRRVARTALAAPLMMTGGMLVLTLGSANVLAASAGVASAKTPVTASQPHDFDHVECSPGTVSEDQGKCVVTFRDPRTLVERHPLGQQVCFTVNPPRAGHVRTGSTPSNCALVESTASGPEALGTFTASDRYCGLARIIATEPKESEQTHHTTITITCTGAATTTSAVIPAGSPPPPAGGGWLLGAMGVGAALVTGYALRTRRWFAPRRLAAGQSA